MADDYSWITNDPAIAEQFRIVDRAWSNARNAATNLVLKDKLVAYKDADEARAIALQEILANAGIKVTIKQ